MSVTKDYKVVKFSAAECFAVARALRGREATLRDLIDEADARQDQTACTYLVDKLNDVHSAQRALIQAAAQ